MPSSEQKRQKKLAKKQAKTKKRLSDIAKRKQALTSISGKMLAARSGDIIGCFISEESTAPGMRSVLLIRRGPQGLYAAAFFLLDMLCLGVKDCGYHVADRDRIESLRESMDNQLGLVPIEPSTARGIVEAAINYAASFGLPAHGDYRIGKILWGDIPVGKVPADIEFGKDGKPLYIAGPHDDLHRQKFILNALAVTTGEDKFDFITHVLKEDPTIALEEADY